MRYLGLLRLYSIADLCLLLAALRAPLEGCVLILLMWIGFLALLETRHHHSYRAHVPSWIWIACFLVSVFLLPAWQVIGFFLLGGLYSLKQFRAWGLVSPVFRALQMVLIVSIFTGLGALLPWLAGVLIFIRNLTGDIRDIEKDRKEHMLTIPVKAHLSTRIWKPHLLAVLATSFAWWLFSPLTVWWLLAAWAVEVLSYDWTSRKA